MGGRQRNALILGLCWALHGAAAVEPADPVAVVGGFSEFHQIDLRRLLAGEILSARGSLMNFPNGISGQTCFVVPLAADQVAPRLQVWDPSPHESLKVFAFHLLHNPAAPADFQSLNFQSSQHAVRWLLDKTVASTPDRSELNLTRGEAQELAAGLQRRADPRPAAEGWGKILLGRALLFQQQGLAGARPYEVGGETVSPAAQLRAMLLEQLAVAREFSPIFKSIGLLGNGPSASADPVHYWSLFDADHHGTLNLGAVYRLAVGDHYQLADIEYYVSGNFYVSATLYEVWPVRSGDQPGALVWRGDFFAAPMLAFTKGTERIAYGALMLQDIKKEIRCFQDDLKGPGK